MKTPIAVACCVLSGLIAGCVVNVKNEGPVGQAPVVTPGSSYACQSAQVPGSAAEGQGAFGCHFYLHHPETKQILANTAYYLAIFRAGESARSERERVVVLRGVTDAQGRSGYVRAPSPITPDMMQFVEAIGEGPYSRSPHLLSPLNGRPISYMRYYISGCGEPYAGMTDEQGYAVMFQSKTACDANIAFYSRR